MATKYYIENENGTTLSERSDDKDSYTYTFSDGTTSTIRVGDVDENGAVVTAEMIKLLHQMDDKEMYNNRKNTKVPIGKWEVPGIERWKAAHPGEPLPTRYHIPLDALTKSEEGDDDCDKGNLAMASFALISREDTPSPAVNHLRQIIAKMKPKQQWLYRRIVIERATLTEVAEETGVTATAIKYQMDTIKRFIQKNF